MKNVIFAEERWAKREEPASKKADTSKYYRTNKPNENKQTNKHIYIYIYIYT